MRWAEMYLGKAHSRHTTASSFAPSTCREVRTKLTNPPLAWRWTSGTAGPASSSGGLPGGR